MAGIHEINTYQISYRSSKVTTNWGGFVFKNHGRIVCDGNGTNDRLLITIAPDDEPIHGGATVMAPGGGDVGFIAIRRADLNAFVDILRNESPVYMQVYAGNAGSFNRIFTGAEPVGEGEETVL